MMQPVVKFSGVLMLLLGMCHAAIAQEAQPLLRGSYQNITSTHTGKPFIVALWSLSCTHCGADMEMFEWLLKKYPTLNLVLISTDTPDQDIAIAQRLRQYHLDKSARNKYMNLESWVFADSFIERLHFEVDAQWYGELPRTYFFDASGKSTAVSGVLRADFVDNWVREKL
jgi:thiol-disulfide isomerase/thioredoxin